MSDQRLPDDLEPMLTKRGVSHFLGISERTVDRLVASRRLRCFQVGGHRRFRLSDVEAFVLRNEVGRR